MLLAASVAMIVHRLLEWGAGLPPEAPIGTALLADSIPGIPPATAVIAEAASPPGEASSTVFFAVAFRAVFFSTGRQVPKLK